MKEYEKLIKQCKSVEDLFKVINEQFAKNVSLEELKIAFEKDKPSHLIFFDAYPNGEVKMVIVEKNAEQLQNFIKESDSKTFKDLAHKILIKMRNTNN